MKEKNLDSKVCKESSQIAVRSKKEGPLTNPIPLLLPTACVASYSMRSGKELLSTIRGFRL